MIISFCFTIKIINSIDNLERYQTMISKAVNCAKEHHTVNFYTDAETLPYLDIEGVDIKLIDTNGFYFVDDFKIHLLSIISDEEILVDTDLFLFKELKLEDDKDASELGFEKINEIINNTSVLTFERLIQLKLGLLWI